MSQQQHNFVGRTNIVTGEQEWQFTSDDYDFDQEIARSSYADMLHDTERNQKYEAALSRVIRRLKAEGREVHVLDIGTGTGLLSMMAVRCGADRVTACEAFPPVARCARKVIDRNGMSEQIRVVGRRSTELDVTRDMGGERANVLVAEVFDTELIGEGALHTFHHAAQELITPDAVVIPSAARLYVQLAQCDWLWQQHHLCSPNGLSLPDDVSQCSGCPAVHDIQLTQLPNVSPLRLLSEPVEVKRFEWGPKAASEIQMRDSRLQEVLITAEGSVQTVLMWWELDMDSEGEIVLSCAPHWTEKKEQPWRDHWMQAVYYPRESRDVIAGDVVTVSIAHDDYSFWFDLMSESKTQKCERSVRPVCSCGMHVAWSRTRIGEASDTLARYNNFLSSVSTSSLAMVITDGSLLSWHLASRGIKTFHIDKNLLSRRFLDRLKRANPISMSSVSLVPSVTDAIDELKGRKIDLVLGEPFFSTSLLPWYNLHFWYALEHLRPHLSPSAVISPLSMRLRAILVEFRDLWKIRAPVGLCENLDITPFDEMISQHAFMTDSSVEAQPLWEYPGRALSSPVTLASLDLSRSSKELALETVFSVKLPVTIAGQLNGIAVWCDWEVSAGAWHSTGLLNYSSSGDHVPLRWNPNCQQGVHLCRSVVDVEVDAWVDMSAVFRRQFGDFDFTFVLCR